jgi:hypothetical protein
VEVRLTHDVRVEYDLDEVGPASGALVLERTLGFRVLEDGAARLEDQRAEVSKERVITGAAYEPHLSECGHPRGCGDPCGWCAAIAETAALRVRTGLLLAAARSGDVRTCMRLIADLGRFGPTDPP